MNPLFDFLFSQYYQYQTYDIILEITAVIFGLFSVWYSKNNSIYVFPTGMISTLIFVYLLYKWELIGDMLINAYYFIMSIYGWYYWACGKNNSPVKISTMTNKDKIDALLIFFGTLIFVTLVYVFFNKWNSFVAYIDTFTTAVFFVGMWLMAKRKIENWILWILGDLISVPLYFYKGLTFTSLQYFIFTIIAFFGYISWKQILNNKQQIV